jgi:CDP-diacylglycerol--serine O-phosphatidyltransferase
MQGFGILLSSLLMVFAGLRLARFNVNLVGHDKDHFVGLPTPASAITVASFMINYWNPSSGLGDMAVFFPYLVASLGLLMVSKVKYDTLPRISRRSLEKEPWKFIFFGLAIIVVFVTAGTAIFPLFLLFIALGILRYVGSFVRRMLTHEEKRSEEESAEPSGIDI